MIVIRLDVPALERLIGGDSEVEVQLRQGVVEEFAKRHLGAVLKDAAFAKFLAAERKVAETWLEARVKEHIGVVEKSQWGTQTTVHLTDAVRTSLMVEADKRVYELVCRAVEEAWAVREKRLVGDVTKAISAKVDALTESLVRDLVRERLSKVATAISEVRS